MWTSISNAAYCSLTVHYITDKWDLVTTSLDCSSFGGSHTAENICHKLEVLLQQYNLSSSKLVACVTDTAPVMRKTGRLIGCDWHGCLAHLLELVTGTLLKLPGILQVLKSSRALVGHFCSSTQALESLKCVSASFGLKWRAPVPDVVTRWWSTYAMAVSMLYLRPALQGLMSALPDTARLTEADWLLLDQTFVLLKPFMSAQKVLKGEKYVTISWVPHILHHLRLGLIDSISNAEAAEPTNTALLNAAKTLYADFQTDLEKTKTVCYP